MSLFWCLPVALATIGVTNGSGLGRIAFTIGWVALGPVTLATWAVGSRIVRGDPVAVRDVITGIRPWLVAGVVFFLAEVFLTTLLVANVRFYFSSTVGILGRPVNALAQEIRVGQLIGLLWLSPLTLWALMQLYLAALVVEQGVSIGRALRRAAILVLDNILFTLGLAIIVAVLLGLLVLSGVGMIALLGGSLSVLTANASHTLLARYAAPTAQ